MVVVNTIGFVLLIRIETGAARTTTIIVDILDIIQQARDTDIYLKVDEEKTTLYNTRHINIATFNTIRKKWGECLYV